MSADAALRKIAGACLAQVLPNAADVAGGVGGPEHLHQLRVGLRRMRCALKVFGDASGATDPGWEPALAGLFGALGSARDRDALAESLLPELQRAGAPLSALSTAPAGADSGLALRAASSTRLLLELMRFAHGAGERVAAAPQPPQPDFVSLLPPRLRRMRRQLKSDAAAFAQGDDAQRHRTRKRLKRLRYSLEFVVGLYASKALKQCLARVRAAQEVLGRYNDLVVAEQAFRVQVEHDPRAWFAIGWLTAQRAAGSRSGAGAREARQGIGRLAAPQAAGGGLSGGAAAAPGSGPDARHRRRTGSQVCNATRSLPDSGAPSLEPVVLANTIRRIRLSRAPGSSSATPACRYRV